MNRTRYHFLDIVSSLHPILERSKHVLRVGRVVNQITTSPKVEEKN